MSATTCAQNPCLARPSAPMPFFFLARKCHLQSTGLENKVSENCRWDGGLRGVSTDTRGVSLPFRIIPKINQD
jgi:hypothetical protein